MNYFDEENTEDEISIDNENNHELIEKQMYQDYLRKENLTSTKDTIVNKRIEMFLKDKNFYLAIKKLPLLERRVFLLFVIKNQTLNDICSSLKISKTQALMLKRKSIRLFIKNLKNIKKNNLKAGGGNHGN